MARALPGGDLAAFVSRSVSSNQYAFRALVLLHAPIERIAERVSPYCGSLEPLDGQRCVLQTGAHSLDALAMSIAMIGVEFEVRDPPELVEHLRRAADRLRRATARPVEEDAPRPTASVLRASV
jgi:predicted DNA-binding transcriptional regulator YafY